MTRDRLISAIIAEIGFTDSVNYNIIDVLLQADFNLQRSKPQLGTVTYYHFPEIQKKLIESVHKEALKILKKKGDIMENATLYEMVKINLFAQFGKIEPIMIDSIIDIYLDLVKGEEKFIGLEKWKILNPSTLKDKAIYVLKKKKEPMHFLDIASSITEYFAEPVKISTIHNELIRNAEFVLIGTWYLCPQGLGIQGWNGSRCHPRYIQEGRRSTLNRRNHRSSPQGSPSEDYNDLHESPK
jgi:hypothetical protein